MSKNYKYIIQEDTTITDLINGELSLFKNYSNDGFSLLRVSQDDKSNLDRIWDAYNAVERKTYGSNYTFGVLSFIKNGTELLLPRGKAPLELVAIGGKNIFLKQDDFVGFWSKEYIKLLDDPKYVKLQGIATKLGASTSQIINNSISVWVYVRSLDSIINLSSFVNFLRTESGAGASSFSMGLNPIKSPEDILQFGQDSVFYHNINEEQYTPSYFHKHIQQNDVVFIKFERLGLKADERIDDFIISRDKLAGQIYDFIGLVDTCSESFSSPETDISINVSGRDLMKLFIEDGSYFYPQLFVEGSDKLFFNPQDTSRWFKRSLIYGTFDYIYFYTMQSIRDNLGFIINQLSNLGVVDNDLFSSYSDKKKEIINITGANQDYLEWNEVNGIWQIVDLLVDENINDRRVANGQISRPDGTLLEQINKICNDPFVEFFGDIYSDKYVLIARQKPFTKKAVQDYIKNDIIEIESKDILFIDLQWEEEYYTWYQIFPKDMFFGNDTNVSLGYIPIVYFPTIADTFGNHRLILSDNYLSNQSLVGDTEGKNRDLFKEAVINDFSFVIDINQMLPFTRRGRIVTNGDRRIKKNTYIRVVPTGEIYYVDSVCNTFSANNKDMDRETTIDVSRGMVEKFIKGDVICKENPKKYTYWDVVDVRRIQTTLISKLTQLSAISVKDTPIIPITNNTDGAASVVNLKNVTRANFDVNEDVFNFFLNRKQFE